jgi:hypothetical protein
MRRLTSPRLAAASIAGAGVFLAYIAALAHGSNAMASMVALLLLSSVIVALAQQTLP